MVSAVVTKRSNDRSDRRGPAAATGAGTVLTGAGLVGGGIPGVPGYGMELGDIKHLSRPKRVLQQARIAPAGIFGARHYSHNKYLGRAKNDERYFRGKPTSAVNHYARGVEAGKIAPEETIVRHLKTGRRISHGVLAGGVGLLAVGHGRGRQRQQQPVRKSEDSRRRTSEALLGAGGTTAVGGYGVARGLENQGRKWAARAEQNYDAAGRLVPGLGGSTKGRSKHRIPRVDAARSDKQVKQMPLLFRRKRAADIERVGQLRGAAKQHSYFGHVYGSIGHTFRRAVVPAGVAVSAVGGAGVLANRKDRVAKAKSPEEAPYRSQRRRATAAKIGYGVSGTTAAVALKAPLAAKLTRNVAAAHGGVPHAVVEHHPKAKPLRDLSEWAVKHPKSSYGLAAGGVGTLAATRVATRYRRGEEQGLSEHIGPMRAERRKPVAKAARPRLPYTNVPTPAYSGKVVQHAKRNVMGVADYSSRNPKRGALISTQRSQNAAGWPPQGIGKSLSEPEYLVYKGRQRRNNPNKKGKNQLTPAQKEAKIRQNHRTAGRSPSPVAAAASEPAENAAKVTRSWFRPRNVALAAGGAALLGGGFLYATRKRGEQFGKAAGASIDKSEVSHGVFRSVSRMTRPERDALYNEYTRGAAARHLRAVKGRPAKRTAYDLLNPAGGDLWGSAIQGRQQTNTGLRRMEYSARSRMERQAKQWPPGYVRKYASTAHEAQRSLSSTGRRIS